MLDKTLNHDDDGGDDDDNYSNHSLSLCVFRQYGRLFPHIISFNLHHLGI